MRVLSELLFGNYRLVELLGRGGMGEVYRAFDTTTDRLVALKVLAPNLATDDSFQQRFRREALAAARLNEPHIVPIHGFGEIDGRLYVDMRLIEGDDLQSVLRAGALPADRAVDIVRQVASALVAAHRAGLVHRDVKPSNILVTQEDFAYLIDFGIARNVDQTGLTRTGVAVGTFAYMAPERLQAAPIDTRSDVYALAAVLHQCLTGQLPFPGSSTEQQIIAHLMSPPPRPTALRPELSAAFDAVVAKGMAKVPEDRYQTAADLARAATDALLTQNRYPVQLPSAAPTQVGAAPPQWPAPHPNADFGNSQPSYIATGQQGPPRRRRNILIAAQLLQWWLRLPWPLSWSSWSAAGVGRRRHLLERHALCRRPIPRAHRALHWIRCS